MSSYHRTEPFEPDDEAGDPTESDALDARRTWPRSAWFAIAFMVLVSLVLGALLVMARIKNSSSVEAPANSTLNAPEFEPTREIAPGAKHLTGQSLEQSPGRIQSHVPAHFHSRPKPRLSEPVSREAKCDTRPTRTKARISLYQAPPRPEIRTLLPAPETAVVLIAHVSPKTSNPPVRIPRQNLPVQSKPMPRTQAYPGAVNGTSGATRQLPNGTRLASRVASVGLPGTDRGLVIPKSAVGPVSPRIEIVARPAVQEIGAPNCGGPVFIPCPVLRTRPSSPDEKR